LVVHTREEAIRIKKINKVVLLQCINNLSISQSVTTALPMN